MWNKLIIKILMGVGVGTTFLLIIFFGVCLNFLEPINLKNQIVHQVLLQTGQQIEIKGNIEWRLTHNLGLRLNDVKGIKVPIVAEKIDAVIAWQPLLSQHVVLKKIQVHNLTLSEKNIKITGDILINLKAQTVEAKNLLIDKDSLHIKGKISGKNILQAPEFNGQFVADQLDLGSSNLRDVTLDLHFANSLSGIIACKSLKIDSLNFTNLSAHLSANDHVLEFSELRGDIKGGVIQGLITADLSGVLPHYTINATLANVKLEQLIPVNVLQGPANILLGVEMQGKTSSALVNSLNGKVQLSASEGIINNVELMKQIQNMGQWFKVSNVTSFSQINASAIINNGLLKNDDLKMQTPDFILTGKGNLDLATTKMDYYLKMQGNVKMFNQKMDFSVPFKVGGTFAKPTFRPDLSSQQTSSLSFKSKDSNKKFGKLLHKNLKNLFSTED